MTDDELPTSRNNSILVRDDAQPSRGQANVHPHFVESVSPYRSPSVALTEEQRSQIDSALQGGPNQPTNVNSQAGLGGTSGSQTSQGSQTTLPGLGGSQSEEGQYTYQDDNLVSPKGEHVGIQSFGIAGSAATDAWLAKPLRPHSPEPIVGRATSKQPSDPRIEMKDGKIHILIGVTGSLYVSSVKQIIAKLQSIYGSRVAIQVIVTPVAEKMISNSSKASQNSQTNQAGQTGQTGQASHSQASQSQANLHNQSQPNQASQSTSTQIESGFRIWHDADEWETWHGRNDPVIHIELRRWADILLICPLSANTLGKIAMGLCDNLLTNVVRAWNAQYPILIAPAMVAYAYNHPATKQHLRIIREEMKWIEILRPTEKVAGSTGGIGMGGMMPWNEIVAHVVQKLGGYPDEDEDEDDEEDEEDTVDENTLDNDEDDDDEDDILQDTIDHQEYSRSGSPI